jgi:nucleoside-diphosphate-sugar epimerase
VRVVAPLRRGRAPEAALAPIGRALAAHGLALDASLLERLSLVELPEPGDMAALDAAVRAFGVEQVIHCAGCLSYFDARALERGNVQLTAALVERARGWGVRRFVYVSTAFSSGDVEGEVREVLHPEPASDPTPYTRSKRRAERIVAESGLPYLVLRPAAVIGDSRDGHYYGPRYGLYQLWSGLGRHLFTHWHREMHYVAPRVPVHLLHQDAFQGAFLAAWRHLPDGAIAHLTSSGELDARAVADLWFRRCMAPERVFYYERLEDVPFRAIDRRQRAFLALASTNIRISSQPRRFETSALERLRAGGADIPEVSLSSVAACQDAFVAGFRRIRQFQQAHRDRFGRSIDVVEVRPAEFSSPLRGPGCR